MVSGVGVAVRTGIEPEFGRGAVALAARAPETEFERGMRRFGYLILQVVTFLVRFVFLVNALLRRDPVESFLFSVALAVGLTPELLPMIVSVTLASGAVRMARREVIVKQLAAIENFGSMDILLSDKTGTLTEGEIAVDRHVNLAAEEDERVIQLAALNSAHQTGLPSPMDAAVQPPALAWGVTGSAVAGALLPFTPAASFLGFTRLRPLFFGVLIVTVATYLAAVEGVKRGFYRRYTA